MPDGKVLEAFGLPPESSEREIAERLWALAGLPRGPRNTELWMRVITGIERVRRAHIGPSGRPGGDGATLSNGVSEYAIVGRREPDEEKWGAAAWHEELGLAAGDDAEEWMRNFTYDQIAPRLGRAGLYYGLDYLHTDA